MRQSERNIQNTLVCLIHGLIGRKTTVELRNEDKIFGEIEDVDEYMSIDIKSATYINARGHMLKYERFYVKGNNVRYVHIPPDVDIVKTIEREIDNFKRKETYNEKGSKPKRLTTAELKEKRKMKIDKHVEEMKRKLNLQ